MIKYIPHLHLLHLSTKNKDDEPLQAYLNPFSKLILLNTFCIIVFFLSKLSLINHLKVFQNTSRVQTRKSKKIMIKDHINSNLANRHPSQKMLPPIDLLRLAQQQRGRSTWPRDWLLLLTCHKLGLAPMCSVCHLRVTIRSMHKFGRYMWSCFSP